MNPSARKFVGMIALLAGLALYVVGAVVLADYVPKHWLLQLIYFAAAGIGWAAPAIPLLKWINAAPEGGKK